MNPREQGLHAWQVVDQLKLRGYQIGNAQISEKHPNFIVNLGGAKASDVRALIDLVKKRAFQELKIELHEEVKTIP
jgi:UDP-N-acetylmuramate dehydrogenase